MKHRVLKGIPKETFLTVVHYCKQYPLWVAELNSIADTRKAIRYDTDKVQTTPDNDSTFEAAVRISRLSEKVATIQDAAALVADDLADWIILGACYDLPYYALRQRGIPCGKNLYYQLRKMFYFRIAEKVG